MFNEIFDKYALATFEASTLLILTCDNYCDNNAKYNY